MTTAYTSLDGLATALGLPRTYLRELADEGQIPFLDVRGRRRFSEPQVREALRQRAEQTLAEVHGLEGE